MARSRALVPVSRVFLRVAGAGAFAVALSFAPFSLLPRLGLGGLLAAPSPAATPGADAVAEDDVATLLPADLWAAVEGRGLGAVATGWLDSRLHQRIASNTAWKKFEQSPQHAQLVAGLGFAQLVSGMKPADLLGALLGDQLAAGLVPDGDKPGVAAVIRTLDADTAEHLVSVARTLALSNKDAPVPARTMNHRGVDTTVVNDKLWFAAVDRTILLASSEPLIHGLIERAKADGRPPVPALVKAIRDRQKGTGSEPLLRFGIDAKKVATTRPDGRLAPAKSDNMGGAMLVGDLLELASRADVICGSLDARGDELELEVSVPGEPAKLPEHFRSFGHRNAQLPLAALAPENTLLTWSVRRDWARFWADHTELCIPEAEKEFAELKTNLGLFFGGKSLPDDVLPQLDEEILFVLSRQEFKGIANPPAVKYPAGAFVYRAKGDVAKVGRDFAIGVHSLVGLLNLERAQQNQTPFLPFVDTFEGVTVWGGRCITDDGRPPDAVRFNYSPAVAWVNDRIILSSSEELLHDLVRDLKRPATMAAAPGRTGLLPAGCTQYLRVDGAAAQLLAQDDRAALVTNAVLDEGKSQEQAETEIDFLIEALGQLSHASIATFVEKDGMRVEVVAALVPMKLSAATTPGPSSTPGGPR